MTGPRIPAEPLSYERFPSSALSSDGMVVLPADHTPRYGSATLDVEYAHKSGRPLHLQVLTPPVAGPHPLVVYVQGSAWGEQNLGQELPALADFTRRGYVVAIVEYRPSVVAPFPAQVRDLASAVRFLHRHADWFDIAPGRTALWGDSSGGHTVVMAALTDGNPFFRDAGEGCEPLGVRCVVDYYGPSDITRMNDEPSTMDHTTADSPEGLLLGGHPVLADPGLAAPTNPVNHIGDSPVPPVLVVHGSKDRLVPFGQSVLLVDALRAAGHPVTFYRLEGADHGGPPFWAGPVLDVVERFLQENIAPATTRTPREERRMSNGEDFNTQVIEEFRANAGRVGGPFAGAPLVLLHHRGRKSGREFTAPMMYLQDEDDADTTYVFASKGGAPTNPDWYFNLLDAGRATVEVGTQTYDVEVREITGADRDRVYAEQARRYPGFAEYERKTAGVRTIPVLALTRIRS